MRRTPRSCPTPRSRTWPSGSRCCDAASASSPTATRTLHPRRDPRRGSPGGRDRPRLGGGRRRRRGLRRRHVPDGGAHRAGRRAGRASPAAPRRRRRARSRTARSSRRGRRRRSLDLASGEHVLVVSFSKCLGAAGGAVLGSRANVERVRASSPYACTTAPPPASTAAALAALRVVRDEPERRARALANATRLHAIVDAHAGEERRSVLFPVRALVPRDAEHARDLEREFQRAELFVPLVRYPGGPSPSYFRIAVGSEHTANDLERLADALDAADRSDQRRGNG
ncbi:MAG: aminotransferase class I/II-fold pyridoxal phosphate-dependent enzyme [Planctomycetota bacterium]